MGKPKRLQFAVVILTFVLLFVYLKFGKIFFDSPNTETEVKSDPLLESFENFQKDFQDLLSETKESSKTAQEIIRSLSDKNSEVKFTEEEIEILRKKIERQALLTGNLRFLSEEMKTTLPNFWKLETETLTASFAGMDGLMKFVFNDGKVCQHCFDNECSHFLEIHNIFSYHVYEAPTSTDSLNTEFQKIQERHRENQCSPELIFKNNTYIFLDPCSNEIRCEQSTQPKDSIIDFFSKNPNNSNPVDVK